jgi:hypothetical protein
MAEFNKSLTKTSALFKRIGTSLTSAFGGLDKQVKRASKVIDIELNKRIKESTKAFNDFANATKKAMNESLKHVKKGSAEEKKIVSNTIKEIQRERKKAADNNRRLQEQQSKKLIAQQKKAAKDLQAALGQFKNPIGDVEKDEKIKSVQDLGRALQSNQKDIQERLRRQLKNLDSQKLEDIKKGEENTIKIINEANRRRMEAIKRAGKERLRLAGKDAKKRRQIERETQEALTRVGREGLRQRAAVRRTAAQRRQDAPRERRFGRIGRGGALIGELGQAAQRTTGSLGMLGGALGKLGPIGIAVAAALGGIIAILSKASEAFNQFRDGAAKVKTLLTDEQAQKLDAPLGRLRNVAVETGEPIRNLQEGLFNVISAVPKLASNIDAAAVIVEKASKAALGMGASTDKVALAVTNMGNAMGLSLEDAENVDMIMDVLANTMKQGVIPSGEALASNIAKTAPTMRFLFKNTNDLQGSMKEATKSIGAMTAIMTANGVSVEEAQTKMRSLGNALLDSKNQAKLFELGVEGINKETGKVEDIRKVFQSMSRDVGAFTDVFTRKEAKDAVRIFTKNAGQDFSDMMDTMDAAKGTANFMFETMADTAEVTNKRLSAATNDFFIQIGEGVGNFTRGLKEGITDALVFITDLFKSSEQKFQELSAEFDEIDNNIQGINDIMKDTSSIINTVGQEIQKTGQITEESQNKVDEQIRRIGLTAGEFKEEFPFIAENIQRIVDASPKGEGTVAVLQSLNKEMDTLRGFLQAEAILKAEEALEEGFEALDDNIDDATEAAKGFATAMELRGDIDIEVGIDSDDVLGSAERSMEAIRERSKEIFAEAERLKALKRDGAIEEVEFAERMEELDEERKKLRIGLSAFDKARRAVETEIGSKIAKAVGLARQKAEHDQTELDILEVIAKTRQDILNNRDLEGRSLQFMNDQLREQLLMEGQRTNNIELVQQAKQEELAQAQALVIIGQATGDLSQEELDIAWERIGVLQDQVGTLEQGLMITEETVGAQDEQVALEEELTALKQDAANIEEEKEFITSSVNDMTKDILDDESLTTDEKLKQLDAMIEQTNEKAREAEEARRSKEEEIKKIVANMKNKELTADQQKAAEATVIALKKQVAELAQASAIARDAAAQIGEKRGKLIAETTVTELLGPRRRPTRAGGRARKSDAEREAEKAEKKRQKDMEKAQKEEQKRREKAFKEAQKIAKEAQAAEMKALKERRKADENERKRKLKQFQEELKASEKVQIQKIEEATQARKLAESMARAQKKLKEDMEKFGKELQKQNAQFARENLSALSALLVPFKTNAQRLAEQIDALTLSTKKSKDAIIEQIDALNKRNEQLMQEAADPNIPVLESESIVSLQQAISALTSDPALDAVDKLIVKINDLKRTFETLKGEADKVQKKNEELTKKIFEQEQAVTAAQWDYNQLSKSHKDTGKDTTAAQNAINALNASVAKWGAGSDKSEDELKSLIKALKELGVNVTGNKASVDGITESWTNWGKAGTNLQTIINKVKGGTKDSSTEMSEAQKKWGSAQNKLNQLREEFTTVNDRAVKSAKDARDQAQKNIGTAELEAAEAKKNAGKKAAQLEELRNKEEALQKERTDNIAEMAELTKQITPIEEGGLSPKEAEGILTRLRTTATGFGELSTEFNKVIALQNQALEAADPTEAMQKFEEAERLSNRITKDFGIFGLSFENLVKQFGELDKIKAEKLVKALQASEDVTEEERANAKILLDSALKLLKLRGDSENKIIETNRELKNTIILTKELEQLQQNYNTAIDEGKAFLKEGTEEELDLVQQLEKRYNANIQNLKTQAETAENLANASQKIIDANETQLEGEDGLNKKVKEREAIVAELVNKRAQLEALPEEAQRPEELKRINAALKERVPELTELKDRQDDLTTAIADETIKRDENNKKAAKAKQLAKDIKKEQPTKKDVAEREKAIDNLDKAMGGLSTNMFDFLKTTNQAGKAIRKAFAAGETEKALMATAKLAENTIDTLNGVVDFGEQAVQKFNEMTEALAEGDTARGVETGGDLIQQIGKTLLQSAIPEVAMAGAIILGIGFITSMVGKIIALFGKEKSRQVIAEEQVATIEAQNEQYQLQLGLMNDLADMGDRSLDTAEERLEAIRESTRELAKQNPELAKALGLVKEDRKAVQEKVNAMEQENINRNLAIKLLENAKGLYEEEQRAAIEAAEKLLGIELLVGRVITNAELNKFIKNLTAEVTEAEAEIGTFQLALDLDKEEFEALKVVFDELVEELDFLIDVKVSTGDIKGALDLVEERVNILGTKALTGLKEIGADVAGMTFDTADEVRDFIAGLGDIKIPPDVQESLDAFVNALDSALATRLSMLDTEKELIESRKKAGKITETQALKRTLRLVQKQIKAVERQIRLGDDSIETEILLNNLLAEQLDIEKQITGEKEDQNAEDEKANAALSKLVRKRQDYLESVRALTGGGTLTSQQRQDLNKINEEIVEQMRAAGVPEEQIQKFMSTLPTFETGGEVPDTGLAIVHKGELIIPANMVASLKDQLLQLTDLALVTNPIINGTADITRQATQLMMQKEINKTQNNNLIFNGDTIFNIQVRDNATAAELKSLLERERNNQVLRLVQSGIDQNKIDMRNKLA